MHTLTPDTAHLRVHHVLQQDVRKNGSVIQELVDQGLYDGKSQLTYNPYNLLAFSNDGELADSVGVIRHAGNHNPIEKVQIKILDGYADAEVKGQGGLTNADVIRGNTGTLRLAFLWSRLDRVGEPSGVTIPHAPENGSTDLAG